MAGPLQPSGFDLLMFLIGVGGSLLILALVLTGAGPFESPWGG